MKMSVAVLSIAVDALIGSLRIGDEDGRIFRYTRETREEAMKNLLEVIRQLTVTIEADESETK